MTDLSDLSSDIDALEEGLSGASGMAAQFNAELQRIHTTFAATGGGVTRLERALSRGLGRAIDGVVLDGMKLSDALREVANAMISSAYKAAVRPVTDHFGGLIAGGVAQLFGGAFADGAAFSQGRVMPFAKGGVLSGPVAFPMRGGTGLMGEAGPEAIMPLTRAADGSLGVRAQGGGPVNVVMNITTPDVAGFQRSQSQIAAQMGRALGRGQRNR